MGVIQTKVFKSGNSAAVRLPKELGFEPGIVVTIERLGGELRIVAAADRDAEAARIERLIADLDAIGPADEVGPRLPVDIPNRTGLA